MVGYSDGTQLPWSRMETSVCPTCIVELRSQKSKGTAVEVCPSCNGIWMPKGSFDPLVAMRFRGEPMEHTFSAVAELRLTCPQCGHLHQEEYCDECGHVRALECPVDLEELQLVQFAATELEWCGDCGGVWMTGDSRKEMQAQSKPDPALKETSSPPMPSKPFSQGSKVLGEALPEDATQEMQASVEDSDLTLAKERERRKKFMRACDLSGIAVIDGSGDHFEIKTLMEPSAMPEGLDTPSTFELTFDDSDADVSQDSFLDVQCKTCLLIIPLRDALLLHEKYYCEACIVERKARLQTTTTEERRRVERSEALEEPKAGLDAALHRVKDLFTKNH
jgi:Zn-finger nucleic acid-binding protein